MLSLGRAVSTQEDYSFSQQPVPRKGDISLVPPATPPNVLQTEGKKKILKVQTVTFHLVLMLLLEIFVPYSDDQNCYF